MNENERIRLIRVTNKMNQTDFGLRIGIRPSSLSDIERGKCAVSQQVHTAICREFGVSEAWLRTGEGEMFASRSREDELSAAVEQLLSGENAEFRRRLVLLLSRLNADQWDILQQYAQELVEGLPVPVRAAPAAEPEEDTPKDWDHMTREEKIAEFTRQLDEEEKNRRQEAEPAGGASADLLSG